MGIFKQCIFECWNVIWEREKERDDPLNHQLSLLLSNIVYIIFGSQNDHHDDDDTFEKNEVIYLNEFFRFSSISLSTKTKRTKKKFQPVSFSLLSFFFFSSNHHHSNFIKFSNPISISNVHFFSSVYFSNTTLIQSISDTIVCNSQKFENEKEKEKLFTLSFFFANISYMKDSGDNLWFLIIFQTTKNPTFLVPNDVDINFKLNS